MEKVLITGVNGFIGSNLAYFLSSKGYIIYGTIRNTSDISLIKDININLIVIKNNDLDSNDFSDDFDFIIHSASIVSDFIDANRAKQSIFDLTKNLYEKVVLKQKNLKKFIYISTSLVLGYKKLNISENNLGIPLKKNYYVYFKKLSENYIIENCKKDNITYTILRPADVYGPRDRTSCIHMLKGIERGYPVIVGNGNFLFPFCSSNTLCEAVYQAIINEKANNKIYTITSGTDITWKQFFSYFQKRFGKPQKIYIPIILAKTVAFFSIIIHKIIPSFNPSLTPYRITRITSNTSYDISATTKDLNIKPIENYEEELEKIYQWYITIKNQKYNKI